MDIGHLFGLILLLGFLAFFFYANWSGEKKEREKALADLNEKEEELQKIKEANDPDLYEKNLERYQNKLKNDLLYISIKPTKKLLSGEVKIKPLLLKIALYRDDTVLINRLDDMCKKIRHYRKLLLIKNKR